MDNFLKYLTKIINKVNAQIPNFGNLIDKFNTYFSKLIPILGDANVIFPVDDILICLGILGTIRLVLMIIWVFKFLRGLLPF